MKQYIILTAKFVTAEEARKEEMIESYYSNGEWENIYINIDSIDMWYKIIDSETKVVLNISNDFVIVKEPPELIKLLIEYLIQHKDMVFISEEIYKKAIINNEKLQNAVAGKILNKITNNNY